MQASSSRQVFVQSLTRCHHRSRHVALACSRIPARRYATSPGQLPINKSDTAGGPQAATEYCAALVKKLDPEAWLCSYFWPRREREWWLGWRAFNVSRVAQQPRLRITDRPTELIRKQLELHNISSTVTQPALAAIRFQFWRDALSAIWAGASGGAIPQHPVAVILAEMKRYRPVQKYYLNQMIDIRVGLPPASCRQDTFMADDHLSARPKPFPSHPFRQPSNPT